MNLVTNKQHWPRLKANQPDIAMVITEITTGFSGEFVAINVTKREAVNKTPVVNIWADVWSRKL